MEKIKTAVEKIKLSLEQYPLKADSDLHAKNLNKVPTYEEIVFPKCNNQKLTVTKETQILI